MAIGIGGVGQPVPEFVPQRRLRRGRAHQQRHHESERDPRRKAPRQPALHQRYEHREASDAEHQDAQRNTCRNREDGHRAAGEPGADQHIRARQPARATADGRTGGSAHERGNEGTGERSCDVDRGHDGIRRVLAGSQAAGTRLVGQLRASGRNW